MWSGDLYGQGNSLSYFPLYITFSQGNTCYIDSVEHCDPLSSLFVCYRSGWKNYEELMAKSTDDFQVKYILSSKGSLSCSILFGSHLVNKI